MDGHFGRISGQVGHVMGTQRRLNNTFVKKAQFDGRGWCVFRDDKVGGFGLRIYESGEKVFILRYRFHGSKRLFTIGKVRVWSVGEARKRALELLGDIAKGVDPLDRRQVDREDLTFKRFSKLYMERYAKPRKKSWRQDEDRLKKHLIPRFGAKFLRGIKRNDVARWHSSLHATPIQANRCNALLRRMFELAEQWGYVDEGAPNPAAKIEKYKERSRSRWLSAEEIPRLIDAIDSATAPDDKQTLRSQIFYHLQAKGEARLSELAVEIDRDQPTTGGVLRQMCKAGDAVRVRYGVYAPGDPYIERAIFMRVLFWLFLLTGARKAELMSLRWVDVQDRSFVLRGTKNGEDRTVHLSTLAESLLDTLPRRGQWVFPGATRGTHLTSCRRTWNRIRKDSGLQDVRLHDLRRTVGSWVATAGNSILVVQRVLGHRTYKAAQVYARLDNEPVKSAVEDYGDKLEDIRKRRDERK